MFSLVFLDLSKGIPPIENVHLLLFEKWPPEVVRNLTNRIMCVHEFHILFKGFMYTCMGMNLRCCSDTTCLLLEALQLKKEYKHTKLIYLFRVTKSLIQIYGSGNSKTRTLYRMFRVDGLSEKYFELT